MLERPERSDDGVSTLDLVDPGEKTGRKEGFHSAVVEVLDTERARRRGVEIRQGRRADNFVSPV